MEQLLAVLYSTVRQKLNGTVLESLSPTEILWYLFEWPTLCKVIDNACAAMSQDLLLDANVKGWMG